MIEVSVRAFFTTDEGIEVVPKLTWSVKDVAGFSTKLPELIGSFDEMAKSFEEVAGGEVRRMTDAEVKDYIARENEDDDIDVVYER